MTKTTKLSLLAAVVGAGAISASATPTLILNDGVNPAVVVTDNGVGDLNPLPGAVTWSGSLGNWLLNVTTGVTKPAVGSASSPEMDLASVNASSLGGGNLQITFAENGFIPSGVASAAIGGTLTHGGSLTFGTEVNAGLLTLQTFSNGGSSDVPFAGSQSAAFGAAPGYSLEQIVTIHHRGAGITSFDAHLSVPDGGLSAGLLGFALVAVEGLRRKLTR
jgi:hypothetical protein